MILDLARFVEAERPHWTTLEKSLDLLESDPTRTMNLEELERLHILYQRAAADLARVATLASEGELARYLEWLVSRAYAEIHESRDRRRFRPWRWFSVEFPSTFRRHLRAFQLSVALTIVGALFGAFALRIDAEAKSVIMPFSGLQVSPSERVAHEREAKGKELAGKKSRFSAQLMQNNIRVTLTTVALGMTFGFGTLVVLFYNGVTLGAVVFDYIHDGQAIFLMGWLLPHGVIEIPAILVGGQTGFVIAYALIGWGSRISRAERLRAVSRDVVALAGGAALMLVWAGLVESFLSQYHEPVIPYGAKISFGLVEAALLIAFLARAGIGKESREGMSEPRDNSLTIRTPEGIQFALPLAGPFSRMLAVLVDLAAVAALSSVLGKALAPFQAISPDLAGGLAILIDFVIAVVYAMVAEWLWRGQTVGKRLLGLRVVDARGLRLEISQVIIRNLLRFVDALPALYLVGGVACVLSRYRQRVGDMAAGTVVVRAPKLAKPNLDQLLGSKYNSLAESRHLAARLRQKVDPEIARIALEALIRRDQLEPSARLALFAQLAAHFRVLVPYPAEVAEQIADEQYVRDTVELLYRPAERRAAAVPVRS